VLRTLTGPGFKASTFNGPLLDLGCPTGLPTHPTCLRLTHRHPIRRLWQLNSVPNSLTRPQWVGCQFSISKPVKLDPNQKL